MNFYDLLQMIEVNGPDYRGAPYPRRRPDMINEEEIPDNMRLKSLDYQMDYDSDGNRAELFWLTQEDFDDDDFETFIGEVERAINYLITKKHYEEPFLLNVVAECRSGSQWGYGEKWLAFNGADKPEEKDLGQEDKEILIQYCKDHVEGLLEYAYENGDNPADVADYLYHEALDEAEIEGFEQSKYLHDKDAYYKALEEYVKSIGFTIHDVLKIVEDNWGKENESLKEEEEDTQAEYHDELLPEKLRKYLRLRTSLEDYEEELINDLEEEVEVKVLGVLECKDGIDDDNGEIEGAFWCDDDNSYFGISEYPGVYRWFNKDIDEIIEDLGGGDVTYWIEYGDNPRRLEKTKEMDLDEVTEIFNGYVEAYPIAEIHSSDNDESVYYNF